MPVEPESPKGNKLRGLIVDDSPLIRLILKRLLSERHYECDEAKDGPEAIAAFNRHWRERRPYHLICLDYRMPGVDGLGVLTHIRDTEAHSGLPHRAEVIMVTADDARETVTRMIEAGVDGYLLKPVDRARFQEYSKRKLGKTARGRRSIAAD